jgi:spore germination protein YaaH
VDRGDYEREAKVNRRLGATLLAAAALATLAGCAAPGSDPTPTPATTSTQPPLPTEGYLLADSATIHSLDRDAAALATVGIDGVAILATGAAVSDLPANSASLVASAHSRGLTAELVVTNYDKAKGAFSPKIADAVLDSAANRAAVVAQLVSQVSAAGFDGVQIDFDSLDAGNTPGLAALAQQLHDALGAPRTVSMAVAAEGSTAHYFAAGYDFAQLKTTVSRVVLKAFDQHTPTSTKPGPVGGMPWATVALDALLATGLPAGQVDLGVAGYGYSWPGNGSDGTRLSDDDSRALAGDLASYDTAQGEWTAILPDDTVVWWSDARSLSERRDLARSRNLHGIAVWELSLTDPL